MSVNSQKPTRDGGQSQKDEMISRCSFFRGSLCTRELQNKAINLNNLPQSFFATYIPNVFSQEDCENLIQTLIQNRSGWQQRTPVNTGQGLAPNTNQRDHASYRFINSQQACHLLMKLAPILKQNRLVEFPEGNSVTMLTRINPMISFFEFTKGQYFTMHPEMPDQRDEGDISRFTILVYLNENFQGGREEFETLGEIGAPKTGAALIYEQYKKEISHNIVKTGTKYVMRLELEYCREKNFHDVLSKFDRTTRTLIKHVRADLVPSGMAVPRKPRPTQAPRGAPQGSGNDDDNPNLRDLFKRGQQFAAAQEQLKKNMRDRNNGMEQTSQESEVVKDRKKPKKRRIPKLWGKRQ